MALNTHLTPDNKKYYALLHKQLKNSGFKFNPSTLKKIIPLSLDRTMRSVKCNAYSKYLNKKDQGFSPYHSDSWAVFCYNCSHLAYIEGDELTAGSIYYLNKSMHSNDWFYSVELPVHFWSEHTLGTVLGHAKYGDYFLILHGCTVGGSRLNGADNQYPVFGDHVVMYANCSVIGNCIIGSHVVLTANTCVINENIPDNSIVYGVSPNLTIKTNSKEKMTKLFSEIWREEA